MPTKDELQAALDAANEPLAESEAARHELIQKLDATNTQVDELGTALDTAHEKIGGLLSDEDAVDLAEFQAAKRRIQDLDEANQDLRAQIAKLQTGDQAAAAEEAETASENLAGAKLNATEAKRAAEAARKTLFAFDQEAMIDTKAIPDSVLDGNERRGLVRDVNRASEAWSAARVAVSAAKDVVESFAA